MGAPLCLSVGRSHLILWNKLHFSSHRSIYNHNVRDNQMKLKKVFSMVQKQRNIEELSSLYGAISVLSIISTNGDILTLCSIVSVLLTVFNNRFVLVYAVNGHWNLRYRKIVKKFVIKLQTEDISVPVLLKLRKEN